MGALGEEILIPPIVVTPIEADRVPFFLPLLFKIVRLCLTNRRLALITKLTTKSGFPLLFRPESYTVADLDKDLLHPKNLSIPLTDMTQVKAGRERSCFYLKVWYQTPLGAKVYTFISEEGRPRGQVRMDDWTEVIDSAKALLKEPSSP